MERRNELDTIECIKGVSVQHGKTSDRVYLMKPSLTNAEHDKTVVTELAKKTGSSKIVARIPSSWEDTFVENGFIIEARIPGFYGEEAALFAGKFLEKSRSKLTIVKKNEIAAVLESAQNEATLSAHEREKLPPGIELRPLGEGDIVSLCSLYLQVFESYPFPVYDPDYIRQTMEEDVLYFGCFQNRALIAASSAEIDKETSSAELTDFATHPDATGNSLASHLLAAMENALDPLKIRTRYTIARAVSYGMNRTFAGGGYQFCGTLINNTGISGSIESMNVWYLP